MKTFNLAVTIPIALLIMACTSQNETDESQIQLNNQQKIAELQTQVTESEAQVSQLTEEIDGLRLENQALKERIQAQGEGKLYFETTYSGNLQACIEAVSQDISRNSSINNDGELCQSPERLCKSPDIEAFNCFG